MKIISLSHNVAGTACSIAVAIKKNFYNDNKQTDFFDFLTVSMKSINEVIIGREITDFIRNISTYENMVQFKNFDNMISCHDIDNLQRKNPHIKEDEITSSLIEQYNRRRDRLLNTIKGDETIYFLRYCTGYENIEHDEIINFMNNIKNINQDLQFHLILITTNYKEHKTQLPLKLCKMYSNMHMLYLNNYLTSEENKLNHFQIYNTERFDNFVRFRTAYRD